MYQKTAAVLSMALLVASVLSPQPSGAQEEGRQDSLQVEAEILHVPTDRARPESDSVAEVVSADPVLVDAGAIEERISATKQIILDYGHGPTTLRVVNTRVTPSGPFHSVSLVSSNGPVGYGYVSLYDLGLTVELHDDRTAGPIVIEPVENARYATGLSTKSSTHILSRLRLVLDLSHDNPPTEPDPRSEKGERAEPDEGPIENVEAPEDAPDPDKPEIPLEKPSPTDDEADSPQPPKPGASPPEPEGTQTENLVSTTGHAVLDISILYTPAAAAELGSTPYSTHATELTARLNDGFERSATNERVRLVHSRLSAYQPASNENDVIAVLNEADGDLGPTFFLNIFNFVRNSAKSDITLIVTESGTSSIPGVADGPLPGPNTPPSGFNSHAVMYLNITTAAEVGAFHELTHLLGADHRYADDDPCTVPGPQDGFTTETFARGWSYMIQGGHFSTAHNGTVCPTSSLQSTRLSNPNVSILNVPTGDSTHNNAAAVDIHGPAVSNYRSGHFCQVDGDGYDVFISRHMDRITGKAATGSEIVGYRNLMASTWRPVDIVNSVLHRPNTKNKMLPLLRLYEGLLGRVGDRGGADGWSAHLHNGQSLTWVASNFLASGEGVNLHGSASNTSFVTFLYQNGLKRNPDSAGLSYWVGQLDSGNQSRAQVAVGLVTGSESIAALGPEVRVTATWFGIFNGTPSQNSVNYWSAWFASPTHNWSGVLKLLNSTTFANRIYLPGC